MWRVSGEGARGRSTLAARRSVTRAAVTCDDARSQRVLRNISIPAAVIDRRSADAHHYSSDSRANLILDFYVSVACVVYLFVFFFYFCDEALDFSVELRRSFEVGSSLQYCFIVSFVMNKSMMGK